MKKLIALLKVWQVYPGAIVAGLLPWIGPFRKIEMINGLWRPDIDVVTDGCLVIYVLMLAQENLTARAKADLKRSFRRSLATALGCGVACYLIYSYLIHWIDPGFVALLNVLWGGLYVVFFLAIVRTVFTGLLSAR